MPFSSLSTTGTRPPRVPFRRISTKVLGKDYDLSLAFISSARSRALNKRWRRKDRPANVLSFPLDANAGEIFIDLTLAKRQAPDYGESYRHFVGHLFIHGLLHLKGLPHGSKMEREENALRRKFGLTK